MDLHTPRLLLREFRAGDQPSVHAFAADPEVTAFTDWGPNTADDTVAFLTQAARDAAAQPRIRYALAIVDRADDQLIGAVDLRDQLLVRGRWRDRLLFAAVAGPPGR